jgi:4-methyl-5(b-hydroxyethyl)-thiazole monophosphate biosynthesis
MKTVLMILAPGFEELEFAAPYDILKRGGLQVTVASVGPELEVPSVRNLLIKADVRLSEVFSKNYDLVFYPGGGPGTKNLRASQDCVALAQRQVREGRHVAAICAAPLLLGDAGLLKGKQATCFPSCQEELSPMVGGILQDRVVHDGLLHTSRGAGSAAEFGFALLELAAGKAKMQEIKSQMQFV